MAIALGAYEFDARHTTVNERYAEVGGRDEREITVSGVIVGESSAEAIEAALDAMLAAAPEADYSAPFSVRPGRRLWVRREGFQREIAPGALTGAFTLTLRAKPPLEESEEETSEAWAIAASGAAKTFAPGGTAEAWPVITLEASGALVFPSVGDGERSIGYDGIVADGETLVFDGAASRGFLEGNDVTPYLFGEFPRLAPGGTTLTYADDPDSSHSASATVAFRARWW